MKDTRVARTPIRGAAALFWAAPNVLLGTVRAPKLGGRGSSEGPLARWRGSTRSAVPHLAAIFQLSDCLVVCLAVCFSVLQCPGTCSQPYLTNLPSSPPTPLVTPSRLWRPLEHHKHSTDRPRPAASRFAEPFGPHTASRLETKDSSLLICPLASYPSLRLASPCLAVCLSSTPTMDADGAGSGSQDPRNAQVDNAIRAIQQKKPLPEIDFSIHQMEDGSQVSTMERVCKGMCSPAAAHPACQSSRPQATNIIAARHTLTTVALPKQMSKLRLC